MKETCMVCKQEISIFDMVEYGSMGDGENEILTICQKCFQESGPELVFNKSIKNSRSKPKNKKRKKRKKKK